MNRTLRLFLIAVGILAALTVSAWLARPALARPLSEPLPQPPLPHPVEGRENCQECHQPGTPGAPEEETPAAATPPPAPTQVIHPAQSGTQNTCADCHATGDEASQQIVAEWSASIHAERGVICADCHGGNPNEAAMTESMSEDAGFIGAPDRQDIPRLCGSCHANVNLMRQYDLPTDQYAKYLESVHGQRLAAGDTNVATCWDCHDGHATPETNDPRASVYQLNVPQFCARCHADEQYMAAYNIPTNQYDLYVQSVHGVARLQNQDTRAPSCATCHGTHGAAPPGFEEVGNVCGSCHSATQDYYLSGVHSSDNPEAPRCVTCHGRYDVSQPSEAMFMGSEPRTCGNCHEAGSTGGETAQTLYEDLTGADAALTEAQEAVERAARLGMIVYPQENTLAEARTRLITARAAQHTVDLETVRAETDASLELSEQAHQQAEDAIAESQ